MHTPRPWSFDGHGINARGERIAKMSQANYIYESGKPVRNEIFDANARLIASAPDLLEALELILRCDEKGFINLKPPWHNQVRQAIRKARGE